MVRKVSRSSRLSAEFVLRSGVGPSSSITWACTRACWRMSSVRAAEVGSCQPFSAIGLEAALHQQQIVFKLCGAAVGGGRVHGVSALLQLVKHVGEKAAITL